MDRLEKCLSEVSICMEPLVIPTEKNINTYSGIGVISAGFGISEGLPVDVIHMLVAARLLQIKIQDANPGRAQVHYILLADSLAKNKEGTNWGEVDRIIDIYKKSLEPLIGLLCLDARTICSSELPIDAGLDYLSGQSLITRHMQEVLGVDVKIGWAVKKSRASIAIHHRFRSRIECEARDELWFDLETKKIDGYPKIQFCYVAAGSRVLGEGKDAALYDAPPYTAFPGHHRYTIGVEGSCIKTSDDISRFMPAIGEKWGPTVKALIYLKEARMVRPGILPDEVDPARNLPRAVMSVITHLMNVNIG